MYVGMAVGGLKLQIGDTPGAIIPTVAVGRTLVKVSSAVKI